MARREEEWTKEEVRVLKALYRNNSCRDCAGVLVRSAAAVRKKASRLGLGKSRKYRREVLHLKG